LAKICFYCGKELGSGERCNCRTSGSAASNGGSSGNSSASGTNDSKSAKQSNTTNRANKENERQAKERAKEQARRAKQAQQARQAQKPKFEWRSFLLKLMTSSGYSSTDSLPKKIGYSLLQTLFRPVTAIDTFVQRQDIGLSVFYLVLFSLATGLLSLRLFGYTILTFAEGTLLGVVVALILNGMFLLAFRFLSKVRFSFMQILSTFSAPAFILSIFFLFAATGRTSLISFLLTVMAGVVAGALLQFLALKSLSRQSSDSLVINVILVYVLFFSVLGILLNLLVPAATVL